MWRPLSTLMAPANLSTVEVVAQQGAQNTMAQEGVAACGAQGCIAGR